MGRVEILAPAGDYDCFLAAIKAGADAVYLGGIFSARAYAKNFTDEEILSALDYAHFYNRKIYMTLNIVMKQDELDSIGDYLMPFYQRGLDGVIVQDIGLISYISKRFPKLPVHASTQMTITDLDGVKLLRNMGIERVVLARELSLREISYIHKNCDAELECFIHGALCYSYSGKCLMSSFLGGRSGNRGRCAGTCRLPYDDEYTLSCKDICTLKILPKLIEAGISSFKIEGRMKSPEYVAGVVGLYRKYTDLYYSSPKHFKVDENDFDTLLKLYTRSGNCEGYYNTKNGRSMITLSKPGYLKGDDELSRKTFELFTSEDIRKPVDFDFYMKRDENICLVATCLGSSVSLTGDMASPALNRPTTEADVVKQLNKLGNTDFRMGTVNVDIDDGLFIQLGKINEIRRNVLELLREEMLKDYRRPLPQLFCESEAVINDEPDGIRLHVYAKTIDQAKAALLSEQVSDISVDFYALADNMSFLDDSSCNLNCSIFVIMPYVIRNDFYSRYADKVERILKDDRIKGVFADNYETLEYLRSSDYSGEIITDIHMYALNHEAVGTYKTLGATRVTTPIELNKAELLRRNISGEDIIGYGYIPLMVSAQCVQNTRKGCNGLCSVNILKDRYNKEFSAVSECRDCLSTIYNSVPISLHKDMDLIRRLKPYSVRLMFTTEDRDSTLSIINGFSGLLFEGKEYEPDYEYTRGHLLRGVE